MYLFSLCIVIVTLRNAWNGLDEPLGLLWNMKLGKDTIFSIWIWSVLTGSHRFSRGVFLQRLVRLSFPHLQTHALDDASLNERSERHDGVYLDQLFEVFSSTHQTFNLPEKIRHIPFISYSTHNSEHGICAQVLDGCESHMTPPDLPDSNQWFSNYIILVSYFAYLDFAECVRCVWVMWQRFMSS